MTQRFSWVPVVLLLALYAAFMVATNHRLTILDDEGTIVTAANTPVGQTLETFLHGTGQHEHPPLSDLVLHGWLVLTHHSLAWLRVFANIFYLAGLWILAKCGELLGNRKTAWAILAFGILWPFGYFYARITGWYCFCFLLVSLLLFTYVSLLRQNPSLKETRRHWIAFTLVALSLVWSNYYGIAILLLLLMDLAFVRRRFARTQILALLAVSAILIIGFLPLLPALLADAGSTVRPAALPWTTMVEKIGYMLFALVTSVSVAPWFPLWSIPAGIAVLCLFIALLSDKTSRLAAIYFLLLIVGLAITSHLDLKRLLFLTPWLMLSAALCFSTAARLPSRIAVTAAAVAFAIGWLGITTGLHPATRNFYEPWKSVTETTAREAKQGTVIISDNTSYFFYLNHALGLGTYPSASSYLGSDAYRSRGVFVFRDVYPAEANLASTPDTLVVRGAGSTLDMDRLSTTLDQLRHTCILTDETESTPDPANGYKQLLDPNAPMTKYRITLDHFDCSHK